MTIRELEQELEAVRQELYHAATETHRRACRRAIVLLEAELAERRAGDV